MPPVVSIIRRWLSVLIPWCFVLSLGILSITATAQTPFFDYYAPADYGAAIQNWSVVQDGDGLMYVANNDGVLVYDGADWQLVRTPRLVRSLTLAADGTLLVGSVGDFGRLASRPNGELYYDSFGDRLPKNSPPYQDVWRIHQLGERTYFCSYDAIFVFPANGELPAIIRPQTKFTATHRVGDTLYVQSAGEGLLRVADDSTFPCPGTESYADERVMFLWPTGRPDVFLIAGVYRPLMAYDARSGTLAEVPESFAALKARMRSKIPYSLVSMPGGAG